MKKSSIITNFLLLGSLSLTLTACSRSDLAEEVSAAGDLCFIAFGLLAAYLVYKQLNKDQEDEYVKHYSCLGIIAPLAVFGGSILLSIYVPEDIKTSIGTIALIIGIILLVIHLKNKE